MKIVAWLREMIRPTPAFAHCDIPCGIYDPHLAQVAAHTVVRMVDLIRELPEKEADDATNRQLLARYTLVKEQHAEIVKNELRILWGDYFSPDHAKDTPDLHDTVWKALKLASKARQNVDPKLASDLLDATNNVAQMFWKTKKIRTLKVEAPYPTKKPLVVPVLK